MKRVAVLGGGPAGSSAAERLAASGLETIVFDEKLAWEKPCGGGITYKAYNQYPFLLDNDTPKRVVRQTFLAAPRAGRACMDLDQPLLIYSRLDLNNMLLNRAARAGARVEKARVMGLDRTGEGWRIRTPQGTVDADFCVIATGARNPLREVGTSWTAADTMVALGYYVPTVQAHIDIQFLNELEGYIWVFPRDGHLSVGICGKGESAQALRQRLERYMAEHGLETRGSKFYAHMLPALDSKSWGKNRVSGPGWVAVGDAGGLVDPVTGEGLYYAVRSGDLASQAILNDAHAPATKHHAYRALIERDFLGDLYIGSLIARRLYLGKYFFEGVPSQMVRFIQRSPRFRALMQDLFAGTQSYAGLRDRVLSSLNGTLQEVVMGFLFRRLIPAVGKT